MKSHIQGGPGTGISGEAVADLFQKGVKVIGILSFQTVTNQPDRFPDR
jgi:hypothetical protein